MTEERSPQSEQPGGAPAWVFFVLTFLWSWSFWGLAVASGRPWSEPPTLLFYALGGMGPSLTALLLIHLGYGGEVPGAFWARVRETGRISPAWYLIILAVALLPSIVATWAVDGGGASGAAMSGGATGAIVIVAVSAAFAEELGWRGYALDRLLQRRTALAASLVVGVAWTAWHLPFYFIDGTMQQEAGLGSLDFWSDMVTRLPLAVLFAWVYVNTQRSILSAMVLHALDNLASVLVGPEGPQVLARLALLGAWAATVPSVWGADLRAERAAVD